MKNFTRIVPSKTAYDINVFYEKDGEPKQIKKIALNITGEPNGAGNGDIAIEYTLLTREVLRLVAGHE